MPFFKFEIAEVMMVGVKLFLAVICGGILGVERGSKQRPAGFRTYILVCLGATLVMMTNQFICELYATGDPSRMGAQVVSGIGFLGAGTIITTTHNRVKGLTTAAGLWASACIGLAIGVGYFEGAILGTLMILIALVFMQSLDERISNSARMMTVYVEMRDLSIIKSLTDYLKGKTIKIIEMETENIKKDDHTVTVATMTLRAPNRQTLNMLTCMMREVEGVQSVDEI